MAKDFNDSWLLMTALLSFLALVLFTGCGASGDILAPKAIMKLTDVPSSAAIPGTVESVNDSISPGAPLNFGWTVLNQVGVTLKSWSVDYQTQFGEPLPFLSVSNREIYVRTEGSTGGTVGLDVYHGNVIDTMRANEIQLPFTKPDGTLTTRVRSVIAPLRAYVTLNFEDDHGHFITLGAPTSLEFDYELDRKN